MAAEPVPAERLDPHASSRLTVTPAGAADGHRLLRLPGGDPMPSASVPAVSVRQTVGLPDRASPSSLIGKLVRAGLWGVAASVIAGGSIMLHQMLFTGESQLDEFLSTPRSAAVLTADGLRPLTNDDPDLPRKADLVVPPLGPRAVVEPPAPPAPPAAVIPVSSESSGPGSAAEPGDDSSGGASGGGDGDSSGHGSDGDGGGDSSGPGSGGDGDSSGHGSGDDRDGDSSGSGSGRG